MRLREKEKLKMNIEINRTFDLLEHLIVNYPKEDILAGKVGGEWVRYSSHDYYKFAHFMAYGFCEMGLERGDLVVTISNNCPEWNFVDMALSMCGIVHVPVYPTLSAENYLHIFRHCEPRLILVSNNLLLRHIKPALEQMGAQAPSVYTMANIDGEHRILEILKLGIAGRDRQMPIVEQRKESIGPDDWATLIYTSGTTGDPKGVMLSHRNLCSNFLAHAQVQPCDSRCRFLSFLPINHIYERSMNYHYQYLGISIYYAEGLGTIARDLAEVRCDGFCAVPRVMEMFYDKLYAAGKDLTGLKKMIYEAAFRHGSRYDYTRKRYNLWFRLTQWFFDRAVYSKWRDRFGGKPLTVITGGSAIQERMVRLFAAAGIRIYEGYGLSETSPVIAVNNPRGGQVRIGTVGPILKGVEVKFDDDGEVLTRGPHVMMGYYKDPQYTHEVIDDEGWFHTGDIGTLVANRYLKITDRKKDIFKLSGGKYVAPQLLENRLRESEYIDQVMVVGANEKVPAAIISPNFNTLHYWALKYHLHYRDNVELIAMPEVRTKYQQVIDQCNKDFAPHEQIKRFRLVAEEWNSTNGLLSPTLKPRRNLLTEKYRTLISEIYEKNEPTKSGLFSAFRSVELPSLKIPRKE